jgi:hypothetical protein
MISTRLGHEGVPRICDLVVDMTFPTRTSPMNGANVIIRNETKLSLTQINSLLLHQLTLVIHQPIPPCHLAILSCQYVIDRDSESFLGYKLVSVPVHHQYTALVYLRLLCILFVQAVFDGDCRRDIEGFRRHRHCVLLASAPTRLHGAIPTLMVSKTNIALQVVLSAVH